jgi:hypothetical protein
MHILGRHLATGHNRVPINLLYHIIQNDNLIASTDLCCAMRSLKLLMSPPPQDMSHLTANNFRTLTFILLMWRIGRAPNSIPIYSYIKQDATLHTLFISGNCSTCFGWKYYKKHVEQFSDINILCNVASCWIYLLCTEP